MRLSSSVGIAKKVNVTAEVLTLLLNEAVSAAHGLTNVLSTKREVCKLKWSTMSSEAPTSHIIGGRTALNMIGN
jgi:hypothetical protein